MTYNTPEFFIADEMIEFFKKHFRINEYEYTTGNNKVKTKQIFLGHEIIHADIITTPINQPDINILKQELETTKNQLNYSKSQVDYLYTSLAELRKEIAELKSK